jgi:hypothetical protein
VINKTLNIFILFTIVFLLFGSGALSIINKKNIDNKTFTDKVITRNFKYLPVDSNPTIYFTKNLGQFSSEVLFQTYVKDTTVYFCKNNIVTIFINAIKDNQITAQDGSQIYLNHEKLIKPQKFNMNSIVTEFVDANQETIVLGQNKLYHKNNYFIGNDPDHWYTDVPNFQAIIYQDIFPGIDLTYYSVDGLLKYDFIVKPGADPSQIKVQYHGIENIEYKSSGGLAINTKYGSIYEKSPVIYQKISNKKNLVKGKYLLDDNMFGFLIEDTYNANYPLIIDPGLIYSTYFGGSGVEWGEQITVDKEGCVFITGQTGSPDLPTVNPYDGTYNGEYDAFVTKFSAQGDILEYSTFFGGSTYDGAKDIAVDNNGCAYILGWTKSSDLPMVNSFDEIFAPTEDLFVAKFTSSGNQLIYSSYLGGSVSDWNNEEDCGSIAVDGKGCAYVTGTTSCFDFPVYNAYDSSYNGECDAFVTKFSTQGNTLEYSTYVGGTLYDESRSLAIDKNECAYITGDTWSIDFPMENPYDDDYFIDECEEVFVTKLSPQGNSLVYSTYLGGSRLDWPWNIEVDRNGCAYVTGDTQSDDFPTVNAYDDTFNIDSVPPYEKTDAFLTKLSQKGNRLVYSTFLGGTKYDHGGSVAIDENGCAYLAGGTGPLSNSFPVVNPYDDTYNGGIYDAFLAKFTPNGKNLIYCTYLGGTDYDLATGVDFDSNGCAYVFGPTFSTDFPTINAYDDTFNGIRDFYLTKFPEEGGGVSLNSTCLFGLIDLINKGKDYSFMTANHLLYGQFIPFDMQIMSSDEVIIVSNDYFGYIGKYFIMGRFKADLD